MYSMNLLKVAIQHFKMTLLKLQKTFCSANNDDLSEFFFFGCRYVRTYVSRLVIFEKQGKICKTTRISSMVGLEQ